MSQTPMPVPAAESSGVTAATRTARRVVLAAFAATALLVAALTIERLVLHRATDEAVAKVRTAQRTADAVLLEDERLTMSAQLAAATGDPHWVTRYETHLPLIDQAIAAASALVPPAAAARFDEATRVANDKLVAIERQALALVAAGRLGAAQAVLNSAGYQEQKEVLVAGSDLLLDDLRASVDQRLSDLIRNSWLLVGALLCVAGLLFGLLWRRLQYSLVRAELAFEAKQSEVTRLALYDTLTGLANRRYLHMQLESGIARGTRENGRFALLVLDLDGFKPINDRHGHGAGDAVLIEISRRLNANVRKGDVAARLGGDEFVLVLNQSDTGDMAARAATRLLAALSEPIELPQGEVRVSASVGVAFFPDDGRTPDDLIRKADVALYRAKNEGRGEVRFFQASMDDEARHRDALEQDLRAAIAHGQIEPYFQPLIDLVHGGLIGFEVLARWHHPSRGAIPPAEFIPIAEDSGQIDALTMCIARAALLAARSWDPRLTIAINIAPQQLRNEALVESLLGILRETGFPPQRFEIEITENALIGDIDMAKRIVLGLKRHGIRVALDDFGTGYSSLSHLSELPFDKIKIDQSFIHSMLDRHESATIVNAIVSLGRSLNLPTTAEGVESPAEAAMLSKLGCNVGQGYLYSRPVPADGVAAILARFARDEVAA